MKRSHKLAAGVFTAVSLGLAAAVFAHPGGMGGGMGMHGKAGMQQGMHGAGQQMITPEERQKLAEANRAEMEKRAKEKGVTLPEHRGPRAGATSESNTHAH